MKKKKKETAVAVIKLIIAVVLLGITFIWIIMPTPIYKQQWRPRIRAKANQSTFFGATGTPLLLYMFPVLLIACLACVYIHLKKLRDADIRNQINSGRKGCLGVLRKPVLARGPLGIASGVELAFLIMFLILLVWSFSMYTYRSFSSMTPDFAAKHGVKLWQLRLGKASVNLGLVGNICLAVLFFPVARTTPVLGLLGLTSESSIKYHIWLGHILMTLFTAHGLGFLIKWASTNDLSNMLEWPNTGISLLAGEISLVAGLAMWATTFPRIRRKMFEVFFYTHYLYIVFMLFYVLHVGISYSLMALPGFYLFIIDRCIRFLQSRRKVRLASARVLPCAAVELNFSKDPELTYSPTSILFLNVPSISKLQWHPFSITSSSNLEQDKLSVVIKAGGNWTTRLYQILSSHSLSDTLKFSVEGPYGPPSTDFLRYDSLVMVSGGVGITPFISILRDLISRCGNVKRGTPRITLICAFKTVSELTMLNLIVPMTGGVSSILNLQIEAFVTRENEPPNINESRTIRLNWFKPNNAADSPISHVLGPNGWLWFGIIISSSFVIFMVLIGIITQFYIYPIDHNTDKVFSYSLRAALNLLIICISIAAAASLAVLRNKKRSAAEANQVQNVEVSDTFETELESFPQQSLIQAANIHYGKRPDLKKILSETNGSSSVKVLASGPKKLRHEVAMICSSSQSDNLEFESMSFSW